MINISFKHLAIETYSVFHIVVPITQIKINLY